MKRLFPILVLFSVVLYIGCGGDDDNGGGTGPTTTIPSLQVNTTVTADLTGNALAAAWNTVDSLIVDVSGSKPPSKVVPSQALVYTPEVTVKAVQRDDTLFLWLRWTDTTHSVWPSVYTINSAVPLRFNERSPLDEGAEDQMYVMFDGAPGGNWDVWNWRVVTTGGAHFAEGASWSGSALTNDAKGTGASFVIARENQPIAGDDPTYAHEDTSDFHGYLLFDTAKISRSDTIITADEDTVFWHETSKWEIGQKIPGFYIDNSINAPGITEGNLGSRWDIRTVSHYDSSSTQYTLVLHRKLDTDYNEDIDLSAVDSVKVRLGILNDERYLITGSANRGFSEEFWIKF
ncbi:MAG: hypothetical protein KOO62_00550 [candidate division Zixibacteria bacterium]|nr:hypothetical protein [candidate division Zixibacteria bacterium]